MAEIFKENINVLSIELQEILLDDMVTAFQNRLNVLIRAQEKGIDAPTLDDDARTETRAHAQIARELMKKLKPIRIKLEIGAQLKLDEEVIAEKDSDGRIIIYEVVRG